jgi:hypothetical protein
MVSGGVMEITSKRLMLTHMGLNIKGEKCCDSPLTE